MIKIEFFDFSALLQALEGVTFGFDPEKNLGSEDDRRKITECNREYDSWQKFEIRMAELPLGNHYHERKTETFYFMNGEGTIYLAMAKEGAVVGEITKVQVQPGMAITIPTNVAHRFNMNKGAKFICHSSAPFNPQDMDMIKCVIEIE